MEKPLLWHQGLFLQPQHLQLSDLYHKSNFYPYHKFLNSHLNGVCSLEIRESALSNFSFHITRGEFWFDDNTYAVINENAVLESRFFKDEWYKTKNAVKVYVGLRKYTKQDKNVTSITPHSNLSEINTRFISKEDPEQITDIHEGKSTADVKQMNYLLKIFFDTEIDNLGSYSLIPVAVIERQNEEIRLSGEFIPPCVSISSSEVLFEEIKEIYNHLLFRGRELEAHKKRRGIHNAEFGSRDMVYLLALRSFNRYIPVLNQIIEEKRQHPCSLYLLLRQMTGELSSFSENIDVLGRSIQKSDDLLPYDHDNLFECFSGVSLIIKKLLEEITAGPEYIIPLNFDGKYFSTALKNENLAGNNLYYLVIKTEEETDKIVSNVDIGVKLSTSRDLPFLIMKSLPGAILEHLPNPPQELPRRSSSFYYRIDNFGEQWTKIVKEKSMSLYWEEAPEDAKIELMIVGRR